MTTLRSIVTQALRESNIVAVGETPPAEEFDESLVRLQTFIKSLLGYEVGEPLTDVVYGVDNLTSTSVISLDEASEIQQTYIPSNSRLVFNLSAGVTLYLNPSPKDGARVAVIDSAGNFSSNPVVLDANGRGIESAESVTLSTDAMSREWLYRGDLGSWVRVTDLTASDESPFPREFDDFLITSLAIRLNPRYGKATSPELLEAFRRSRNHLRARYTQTKHFPLDPGLVASGYSTTSFKLGRP